MRQLRDLSTSGQYFHGEMKGSTFVALNENGDSGQSVSVPINVGVDICMVYNTPHGWVKRSPLNNANETITESFQDLSLWSDNSPDIAYLNSNPDTLKDLWTYRKVHAGFDKKKMTHFWSGNDVGNGVLVKENAELFAFEWVRDVVYDVTNIATEFTTLLGAESSTGELVATAIEGMGSSNVDQVSKTKATPDMTNNITPSGVCSASSTYSSTHPVWKAFMGKAVVASDSWASANNSFAGWLQYEFPVAIAIGRYTILARTGDNNGVIGYPKDFTFKASNTGAFNGEEVILDTQTGITVSAQGDSHTFSFSNTVPYKYYRLNTTLVNGGNHVVVGELELFEQRYSDTITLIDNVESDFVLQNMSENSTADMLSTLVPIADGDNLVIVKDDDSVHKMVASGVTGTYTMDTSAITQGEIPSRVFAQPKVAFDVGSGFVESALDGSTPVLNGANIATHNKYASTKTSTSAFSCGLALRQVGDKMTDMKFKLYKDK